MFFVKFTLIIACGFIIIKCSIFSIVRWKCASHGVQVWILLNPSFNCYLDCYDFNELENLMNCGFQILNSNRRRLQFNIATGVYDSFQITFVQQSMKLLLQASLSYLRFTGIFLFVNIMLILFTSMILFGHQTIFLKCQRNKVLKIWIQKYVSDFA